MSLFQSNLRKQIRNLPKILNFVKKIHYYSKLFTSLLSEVCAVLAMLAGRSNPALRDKGLTLLIMCVWVSCAMHGTWLKPHLAKAKGAKGAKEA